MERRELFKIIAAGALVPSAAAQHAGHGHGASRGVWTGPLRFFNARQNELVDRLCEIVLPADERSPGAHEAGVSYFIDLVLHYDTPEVRGQWTAGIELVDGAAQQRFDKPFLACSAGQQDQLVAAMAEKESDGNDPLGRFFVALKRLTIEGYYYSEVGLRQELGYKGLDTVTEFPGCTHSGHMA
ncbi:MAG: gluconate 2-dehydrogenase subunit 3 family protein [Bryobacteraceae bacterium]